MQFQQLQHYQNPWQTYYDYPCTPTIFRYSGLPDVVLLKDDTKYESLPDYTIPLPFKKTCLNNGPATRLPIMYPPPFQYDKTLVPDSPFVSNPSGVSVAEACSLSNSEKPIWERSCSAGFEEVQCGEEADVVPMEWKRQPW